LVNLGDDFTGGVKVVAVNFPQSLLQILQILLELHLIAANLSVARLNLLDEGLQVLPASSEDCTNKET
jgi:hypothetical protein